MTPRELATAMLAVLRRDAALFFSYRTRAASLTLAGMVGVTIFYYVSRLVRVGATGTTESYYGYVTIGLVTLGVISAALTGPAATLRQELLSGTFERVVVSPLGAVAGIVSMAMLPIAVATVTGTITLGWALVVFDLDITWDTAVLAVPVGLLGVLAFLPFGLAIAAVAVVTKQAQAGATLVVTAVSLVAGIYFPPQLLPSWLSWLSSVQPFTPMLELMRNVLIGAELDGPAWAEVLRLAGFAAIALPATLLLLRAAVQSARRRATIIEH